MAPLWINRCPDCVYLGSFIDPCVEKCSFDCYACMKNGYFKKIFQSCCLMVRNNLHKELFIQHAFFNAKLEGLYKFHKIIWDMSFCNEEEQELTEVNCICEKCDIPYQVASFNFIQCPLCRREKEIMWQYSEIIRRRGIMPIKNNL